MQKITFLTRVRNYTNAGKHGKSGLAKSIAHSMRVGNSLNHQVNHIPKLSNQNKFFLVDDDYRHREVEAMEVVVGLNDELARFETKELLSSERESRDHLYDQLCWIRAKFDKYKCKSEEEENFWQELKACADIKICESFREKFGEIDVARRNQKVTQIGNYIAALKKLEEKNYAPRLERGANLKTIMQEQLFKIPLKNKVGMDKVDVNTYVDLIKNLNQEISTDCHLKAIAMHLDEKGIAKENYGLHAHVYVSGRNANGEQNLLQKQIKWADEYCNKYSPDMNIAFKKDFEIESKLLLEAKNSNCIKHPDNEAYFNKMYAVEAEKLNGKLHGRLWQESIRVFTNDFFEKRGLGLTVENHYQTKHNTALLADQDLPINQREFNGNILRLKETMQMQESLKVKLLELDCKKEELENTIKIQSEEFCNNVRINDDLLLNNASLKIQETEHQEKINFLRKNMQNLVSKILPLFTAALAAIRVEPKIQEEIENTCADNMLDEINSFANKMNMNSEEEINSFVGSINEAIAIEDTQHKTQIASKIETKARRIKYN